MKMKIKLKCIYGKNGVDDVIEVEKKVAESLIKDGAAVESVEVVTLPSEEAIALQKEVVSLSADKTALEEEVKTLKAGKIALEKQVKALQK